MLKNKILDSLKKELPEGNVAVEDDSDGTVIKFHLEVGSNNLVCFAFILTDDTVFQVYCHTDIKEKQIDELEKLLGKVNAQIPFGNFQINSTGIVCYRTYIFVDESSSTDALIERALGWASVALEENFAAITAVAGGFVSAATAWDLLKQKSSDRKEETEQESQEHVPPAP